MSIAFLRKALPHDSIENVCKQRTDSIVVMTDDVTP